MFYAYAFCSSDMRMKVSEIYMKKEPDGSIHPIGVSKFSDHKSGRQSNDLDSCKHSVCSNEAPPKISQVEKKKHGVPNLDCESGLLMEKVKSKSQNTKGDGNKSEIRVKNATKSTPGTIKTKHTVPQPFALATERRAQCVTRPTVDETDTLTPGRRSYHFTSNLNTRCSLKQTEVRPCTNNRSKLLTISNSFCNCFVSGLCASVLFFPEHLSLSNLKIEPITLWFHFIFIFWFHTWLLNCMISKLNYQQLL